MRHQNEMITSDKLANDLHWGRRAHKNEWATPMYTSQSYPLIFSYSRILSNCGWDSHAEPEMFSTQEHAVVFVIVWRVLRHIKTLLPQIIIYISTQGSFFHSLPHTQKHKHAEIHPMLSRPKVSTDLKTCLWRKRLLLPSRPVKGCLGTTHFILAP